ncbi:MAG: acyltransferase [Chloroflexota bacterium]|nr:MAG: N-acetyltransferase [Chloroflexota bacterium]
MARCNVYIHPTSLVETEHIGDNTRVWAYSHIMAGATIGANCNIGEHCFIESHVTVEDNVTIKNGCCLWEGITIGAGAFIGPGVIFTNDLYPRSPRLPEAADRYRTKEWLVPTHVAEGATLGAGAIIVAGCNIGAFATVAAGAVVTRSVPAHALMIGAPARRRGWVCVCGRPLTRAGAELSCPHCQRMFVLSGDTVVAR